MKYISQVTGMLFFHPGFSLCQAVTFQQQMVGLPGLSYLQKQLDLTQAVDLPANCTLAFFTLTSDNTCGLCSV